MIGTLGVVVAVAIAVILGVHPWGTSIGATALAMLHLAGTDTMTFLAYEDTLACPGHGALTQA